MCSYQLIIEFVGPALCIGFVLKQSFIEFSQKHSLGTFSSKQYGKGHLCYKKLHIIGKSRNKLVAPSEHSSFSVIALYNAVLLSSCPEDFAG